MSVLDVQIPPISTNLNDPIVAGQTAKEWYLFWHQSGDRINALNEMITYGGSADRLDPSQVPYGALYVESDRGGVIYQNQDGIWHYIAGTMWATLNPDQRPTDLGPNDAGFDFRSTDTDPRYGGREFIWSGTDWIEVTPNRYGTHADRLALTPANLWQGMIYVETDRSEVIYQVQNGVWHYLAGTMWGTLSPDHRPTDLGANDAGFAFRTTDTSAANAPRTFVWSGSEWIETTTVLYGTHAARPVADEKTPPRTLYIETDRGNVIYQQQANTWVYVAGRMYGTLSPDQRPTGLGASDAGFQFQATDQQRQFYWSGTAWVEAIAGNSAQLVTATGTLNLTTTATQIPGLTLTLPTAGNYLVIGVFYFNLVPADSGATLIGLFPPVGTASVAVFNLNLAGIAGGGTVSQQWLYTASAGATISLQAYRAGGAGGSSVLGGHSSLSAIWISS